MRRRLFLCGGTIAGFLLVSQTAVAAPRLESDAAGQDFAAEARLIHRLAACAAVGELPATLDRAVIDHHCRWLEPRIERYRARFLEKGRPFFAQVLPQGLPAVAVYPFGGGDLVTALTTYPEAREITTLSLELVGDPARARSIGAEALEDSLGALRHSMAGLLAQNGSTSLSLMHSQVGGLPGQLVFFLVGLRVHGYEPVSLKFFRVEADGSLHYYTAQEVKAFRGRGQAASRRKRGWTRPDFAEVFANSELTFRPAGAQGLVRVHRHIAANLEDHRMAKERPVLEYLQRRGRVVAITKASSYTLWNRRFSKIREYLLSHMEVMVSDSTGIPPELVAQAGFVQETYGKFAGSFLGASRVYNDRFRALWAGQPYRELGFRFGYLDSAMNDHMVITRRGRPPAPGGMHGGSGTTP